MRVMCRVAAVVASLGAAACAASYPTQPANAVAVAAVKVRYAFPIVNTAVGGSISLTAYAVDGDGVYSDVTSRATWSSSNPSVLRMFNSGASAVGPGTATVTATYQGFNDSITVPVRPTPASTVQQLVPTLNFSISMMEVGQTGDLRASITQSFLTVQDVTDSATWRSSDPGVASVDAKKLTAVTPGNVELVVTYNNFSTWMRLSVSPRRR